MSVDVPLDIWEFALRTAEKDLKECVRGSIPKDSVERLWWTLVTFYLAREMDCSPVLFGPAVRADIHNPHLTKLKNMRVVQ